MIGSKQSCRIGDGNGDQQQQSQRPDEENNLDKSFEKQFSFITTPTRVVDEGLDLLHDVVKANTAEVLNSNSESDNKDDKLSFEANEENLDRRESSSSDGDEKIEELKGDAEDPFVELPGLHRTNGGVQRFRNPGAVHVVPTGREPTSRNCDSGLQDDVNGLSDTEAIPTSDLHTFSDGDTHQQTTVLAEAQPVSQSEDKISWKDPEQPLPQAELIDQDLLQQQMCDDNNNSDKGDQPHQKQHIRRKIEIAIVVIGIVVAAVVAFFIVLSRRNIDQKDQSTIQDAYPDGANDISGEFNETGTTSRPKEQQPYTGKASVAGFPHITHHALVFEANMDCEKVYSEPNIYMRIQCGNTVPTDGKEAIEYKSSSSNIICQRMQPNALECNATFTSNATRFATVFSCGTERNITAENMNDPFSFASVQAFQLWGHSCRSEPSISMGLTRLCGSSFQNPDQWSFINAMDGGVSCPVNQIQPKGNYTLCHAQSVCPTGNIYPCTEDISIDEMTVFDYIQDSLCENVGGDTSSFQQLSQTVIWEKVTDVFRSMKTPDT